jgi:shikimate dehydrogenase
LAIAVYLQARRDDRPARITLVDRDVDRLRTCRTVLSGLPSGRMAQHYVLSDNAARNDDVVAAAAPGSLVINATGMGKDQPGSPLTGAVRFPTGAVVWDLNYRGDLDFLRQARAQAGAAGLTVEDGWRYFIHGWSEVIAEVFGIELTPQILRDLSSAAAEVRS